MSKSLGTAQYTVVAALPATGVEGERVTLSTNSKDYRWDTVVGAWVKLSEHPRVVTRSGAAYTFVAGDQSTYNRFTFSGAKACTVPANATTAFAVDVEIHGRNAITGDLTVTPAGGVTINAPTAGTLVVPPGGTFTLKKVGTNEWDMFGITVLT